jgi:NAD-dependent DNA ligase
VAGFSTLSAEQQAEVEKYIKAGQDAIAAKASGKAPKGGAGTKRKAKKDEDEDEDEDEEEEEKPAKASAPKRPREEKAEGGAKAAAEAPAAAAGTFTNNPSGHTVLFSGLRDPAFEEAVTSRGGKVARSLTKAVTLIVAKKPEDDKGKIKEAREKGIQIIGADAFATALGVTRTSKRKAVPKKRKSKRDEDEGEDDDDEEAGDDEEEEEEFIPRKKRGPPTERS